MSLPVQNNVRALPTLVRAALFVVAAAGALYLAAQPDGYAADAAPKAAASSLDFVPVDAPAVFSVRVADLWKHPAGKVVWEILTEGWPDTLKEVVRGQRGVGPQDVDRVTMFGPLPDPSRMPPVVAVTTLQPYDQKAVLAAMAPEAREQRLPRDPDRSYYFLRTKDNMGIAFLDDHTFVMSRVEAVGAFLVQAGVKKEGPLTPVLKMAEKHLAVVGLNNATNAHLLPPAENMPPDFKPFTPLLKMQVATLTVDLDEQLRADLKLTFAGEADAKQGTAAVDNALDRVRGAFGPATKDLTRDGDAPKLAALLKDIQAALRAAKAEQKDATVEVAAALKIDPEATAAALAEGVQKMRKVAKRNGGDVNEEPDK